MSELPAIDWDLSSVSRNHFTALADETGVSLEQYLYIYFTGCATGILLEVGIVDIAGDRPCDPFIDDLIKYTLMFEEAMRRLFEDRMMQLENPQNT